MTKQQPEFEIPESVRQIAEQSVQQAKNAYDKFVEAAEQAQNVVARSSEALSEGAREVNVTAMTFARSNIEAGFALAQRLVKAKDLKEAMELQADFARKQMETYGEQARKLTSLMSDVASKSGPKS